MINFKFRKRKLLKFLKKTSRGFTLVELLTSIAVISILAGFMVAALNPLGQINKAKDAQRTQDLKQIAESLDTYYNDNNSFPIGIPFGQPWLSQDGRNTYMSKVPQDPDFSSSRCYQYIVNPANPNWYVLIDKLSNSISNTTTSCTLESRTSCTPTGYISGNYRCIVSGIPDCSFIQNYNLNDSQACSYIPLSPAPTGTSGPFATNTPIPTLTPRPTGGPTNTPIPTPTLNPLPATPTPACPSLVRDEDHDGYYVNGSLSPQCSSGSSIFNGRTYYRVSPATTYDWMDQSSALSQTSFDCCDTSASTYPGQTAYFTTANTCSSFDYNCSNGTLEKEPIGTYLCSTTATWYSNSTCTTIVTPANCTGFLSDTGACGNVNANRRTQTSLQRYRIISTCTALSIPNYYPSSYALGCH